MLTKQWKYCFPWSDSIIPKWAGLQACWEKGQLEALDTSQTVLDLNSQKSLINNEHVRDMSHVYQWNWKSQIQSLQWVHVEAKNTGSTTDIASKIMFKFYGHQFSKAFCMNLLRILSILYLRNISYCTYELFICTMSLQTLSFLWVNSLTLNGKKTQKLHNS